MCVCVCWLKANSDDSSLKSVCVCSEFNWKHDPQVPVAYLNQINAPFGSFNCPRRANATTGSCHPAHTHPPPRSIYRNLRRTGLLSLRAHSVHLECTVNMGNVQPDIVLVTVDVWNHTSPAERAGRHGTKTEGSRDERGGGPHRERERARVRE